MEALLSRPREVLPFPPFIVFLFTVVARLCGPRSREVHSISMSRSARSKCSMTTHGKKSQGLA